MISMARSGTVVAYTIIMMTHTKTEQLNKIYTVVMTQMIGRDRYIIGSKSMDWTSIQSLVKSGAQIINTDCKNPRLITLNLNK